MSPKGKLPKALLQAAGDLVVEHGKGSYVWDTLGRRYLDMTSGIGVTGVGHCHPKLVEAVQKQVAILMHGQLNISAHPQLLRFVERLRKVLPEEYHEYAFAQSGSEAVELAIKLARNATGRANIVSFHGGFHGRTMLAASLTNTKINYRRGFGPLMPSIFTSPYAYCFRCACRPDGVKPGLPGPAQPGSSMAKFSSGFQGECCGQPLYELERVFKSQCAPEETAAIIVEPILGEGGYVRAPQSFIEGLRKLADKSGALLIFDEVQSGFGRTGHLFAYEGFEGVKPDIIVMAKGIAGGMPMSGIATRRELMDKALPGSIGGTYAANAVSCAAANAVLDVFEEEKVLQNVVARGKQLRAGLEKLATTFPGTIGDVRGEGLMVGLEFINLSVNAVIERCKDRGVLLLNAGSYDSIRFVPPLTISAKEIDECLEILSAAMADVIAANAETASSE
jgi:4-aminobutyrate aminotransferase